MALPTLDSARDEILGLFRTKWEADTPALNGGSAVLVEWQGVDSKSPPKADEPYARIAVRHTSAGQSTLGPAGGRRFTHSGLVTVQVFAPFSAGGGLSLAEQLAMVARDAFRGVGTDSGIWFRNTRISEVGPSGAWFQLNVVSEFQYDDRG